MIRQDKASARTAPYRTAGVVMPIALSTVWFGNGEQQGDDLVPQLGVADLAERAVSGQHHRRAGGRPDARGGVSGRTSDRSSSLPDFGSPPRRKR
jgi:hypothetical protein